MKKKIILIIIIVVLLLGGGTVWKLNQNSSKVLSTQKTNQSFNGNNQNAFDKTRYATGQPGSIWWVVNKTRPLPEGYAPPDLVVPNVRLRLAKTEDQMHIAAAAAPAVEEMFAAAEKDGVKLVFGSGYRSFAYQKQLHDGYTADSSEADADRTSARPGFSEHQTGLAFDATTVSKNCHLDKCFADLPEGKWLAAHGYEYGFLIRYQLGKESITGYDYEPWHMRYIGKDLAAEMHRTGVSTLEEFFGLPAAPNYLN